MAGKKYWQCRTCKDVHFGENAPEMCPSCGAANDYEELEQDEIKDAFIDSGEEI
jgi:rubrerythrin